MSGAFLVRCPPVRLHPLLLTPSTFIPPTYSVSSFGVVPHTPSLSPFQNVVGRFHRKECPAPTAPLHHALRSRPNADFDPQGGRNGFGFIPGDNIRSPGAHEDASTSQTQHALPATQRGPHPGLRVVIGLHGGGGCSNSLEDWVVQRRLLDEIMDPGMCCSSLFRFGCVTGLAPTIPEMNLRAHDMARFLARGVYRG